MFWTFYNLGRTYSDHRSGAMMRGTAANRLLSTQLLGPHIHSASLGFDAPIRTRPFAPSDTIIRIEDFKPSHRHCMLLHHNSVDANESTWL